MTGRFADRSVLITGAGTGIGAAAARRFSDEGANVLMMGQRREPLDTLARDIGAAVFAGDAADPAQTEEAVALAKQRFGGLDVVVANAGGHGFGSIVETTDAEWSASGRANLDTSMVILRAAMPELIARKGGHLRHRLDRQPGGCGRHVRLHGDETCPDRSRSLDCAGFRGTRRAMQCSLPGMGDDGNGRCRDG
jgi:meso-butanediol dehydrogenase/(S,S)-butanediol dehydrogenase/diacetyl reductase